MALSIPNILFSFLLNSGALYLANKYIEGVVVTESFKDFLIIAGALTLINLIIKPILKLLLGPIIIITLGAGHLLVNAGLLGILDYAFSGVTITGLLPLAYMTALITVVNIITKLKT